MAAPNTRFKQLLLDALTYPQRKTFPTPADAHKARFAMYDAMRRMRRENPPDPYGNMKESLEFIITDLPTGEAELCIQPKSTRLVDCMDDWESDQRPTATSTLRPAPAPAVDVQELQAQLVRSTVEEIDPATPEGARILRRLEINDWLDTMETSPGFPYMEALSILQQMGDTTLGEYREKLSASGVL